MFNILLVQYTGEYEHKSSLINWVLKEVRGLSSTNLPNDAQERVYVTPRLILAPVLAQKTGETRGQSVF